MLAITVAMVTPGTTTITLLTRVFARGASGNVGFCAGLVAGDLLWFTLSAFGVAALAAELHMVMVALKYAGAAYLVYLAYQLWVAPVNWEIAEQVAPSAAHSWRTFFGGITLALSNPKTMLFYLALLPNLVTLAEMSLSLFLTLAAIITVLYSLILAGYVLAAVHLRQVLTSHAARKRVNRCSSVIIGGTAVLVATRA